MFGIVGLGVFIFEQFRKPPEHEVIYFEFVDVFCSAGVIALIVIAAVLFAMQKRMALKSKGLDDPLFTGRNHWLEDVRLATSLRQVNVQKAELHVMCARFRMTHRLTTTFDFKLYLKESLAKNVCDMMNINWVTWTVLFFLTIVLTWIRWCTGHLISSPSAYMILF